MYIKEVASSVYAWDAADEGLERIADRLQELCHINSLYLVGIMHHEKRPLTSLFYTHNDKRKFFVPENSHLYYRPDPANFKGLKAQPIMADFVRESGVDWLDAVTKEARKRGMKTGCELSHTIFDTRLTVERYPELLQRDVNDRPLTEFAMPMVCPNNPDVRAYFSAVFYDVVKNHDIDFLQTACLGFCAGSTVGQPVRAPWYFKEWMDTSHSRLEALLAVARGGCFCEHCEKKAKEKGYDWERIRRDVGKLYRVANATPYVFQEEVMENNLLLGSDLSETALLTDYPGLMDFINFRMECMTEMMEEVYTAAHRARSDVEFRFNCCIKHPEFNGFSFPRIAPFVDSVRDSDYVEQYGDPVDFSVKTSSLLGMRRGIGFEKGLIASIPIRPNTSLNSIQTSLHVLKSMGIDGISLAHYDNARIEHMKAFGKFLEEEDYEIRP